MTDPRTARRRTLAATATAALAVGLLGFGTAPAHADSRPPTPTCNPATDQPWVDITASQVTPTVTDYLGVYVAPGTTGQRSETLTQIDSVTTTVDNKTEITASANVLFGKVEAKVGFSVSKTTSSTRSTTVTNTWNFNDPGKYGLYRATRKVTGQYVKFICAETGPTTGIWVNALPSGPGTFTTYEVPEIGSVACAYPEPAGTARRIVQTLVGC